MEGDKVAEERENLGSLYYEQAKYYFNIEKNYKVSHFINDFKSALDSLDDALKILPTS